MTLFYKPKKTHRFLHPIKSFSLTVFALMITGFCLAQKTAVTSGNWSNAAIWSPSGVPGSADAVIINPGITVTVDVNNAAASSLQLNTAGVGLQTSSLVFNANSQLAITGSLSFALTVDRPGIIDMTAGGTLKTGGFLTGITGTSSFIPGSGTVVFTANNTVPSALFTTFNNLTIAGGTTQLSASTFLTGDLKIQSGTLDQTSYPVTRSGTEAGTVTIEAGATLRVGATSGFPNNFATYNLDATSVVEFYGSSQVIRGTSYGHLFLNGTAKTANGPITVKGNLTTNADFNAGSFTHNLAKNWYNTANFDAGNGMIELYGTTDQRIPGVTFSKLRITNNTGWVAADGNITVKDTFTTTSVFCLLDMGEYMLAMPDTAVVDNRGMIKTQNTTATPIPADKVWGVAPFGTVMYNAANGGQTIVKGTYNNLTAEHTNGGTSTANGDITIEGMINAATASTTINLGSYKLTHTDVGGIGSQNTLGTIRTQNTSLTPLPAGRTWGGTVVYDAVSGGQKIVFGTYNNLTVNSTGTSNVSSSIVVNGNLITSAGAVMNMNQDTITGNFNAAGHAGTLRTQAQMGFPSGKTWGGTVIFDASGDASLPQTIVAGQYNNLSIPLYRGMNNNLNFEADTIKIAGNFDFSAIVEGTGQFVSNNTTFSFNGNNQNINVTAFRMAPNPDEPFRFTNVIIDGGGVKTLLDTVIIDGLLSLKQGVVKSANSALLHLSSTATVDAPAMGVHTSYVEGPLRKTGTTAFTFPVGNSNVYAPVTVGAPGSGGDITAEYLRPQNIGTAFLAPLAKVSGCEYWNITKNGGANTPVITLGWSAESNCNGGNYLTDATNVYVASWDGTQWINAGSELKTGNATMGTITSSATTLANPFGMVTLASDQNILPVTFKSLSAYEKADGINVEWITASELNVQHYEVERSDNGVAFTSIAKVNAKANNGSGAVYDYLDTKAVNGKVFYRIKSTDKDGKQSYSNVVSISKNTKEIYVQLYPNPVRDRNISFSFNSADKGEFNITITDAIGRPVFVQKFQKQQGNYSQQIQLPAQLTKGVYNLRIEGNNTSASKTFIFQ